jgi:predicted enzyme related to lactoylglutathione lyase
MKHRTLLITVVFVLLLLSGWIPSGYAKAPHADVGTGRVSWFDITTTDLAKSKDFYSKLFAWTFNPLKGTDRAVEIVAEGTSIGTLRVAEGKISPFNGVVYIQVSDMQAACKKAQELGGTIVSGFPFNLFDGAGAVGLILDPAGHPLGLYSRTALPPPGSPAK